MGGLVEEQEPDGVYGAEAVEVLVARLPVAIRSAEREPEPAEVVALLGPNGAGKTTALKAIMGLVRVQSGSIYLNEREISTLRAWIQQGALWPDGVDLAKLEDRTESVESKPSACSAS